MAGLTLAQAETKLSEYLAAETKILKGQKVEIDGQLLQRADLGLIQAGIDAWNKRVQNLSAATTGRGRSRTIAPGF